MKRNFFGWILAVLLTLISDMAGAGISTPEKKTDLFPEFVAPGFEQQMEHLRDLFKLHYDGVTYASTIWSEWLPMSNLWPVTARTEQIRRDWKKWLLEMGMEPDGYVFTHQHPSIAHQHGWPFPFWKQSEGTWGWHFSVPTDIPKVWYETEPRDDAGWKHDGGETGGVVDGFLVFHPNTRSAYLETPETDIDPYCSPFVQLRWKATGLGNAHPYLEWITDTDSRYSEKNRFYFETPSDQTVARTMIPVYKHSGWSGRIRRMRLVFDSRTSDAIVSIKALFTQFDTRHDVNNADFILGCDLFFRWTGDVDFLRQNINRMRKALRYILTEYHLEKEKVVLLDYVGHDGRPGFAVRKDGSKDMHWGHGIGSNYWDLLPFGHLDPYATNLSYKALLRMADIEQAIRNHPEWNIPTGACSFEPAQLLSLAPEVRKRYQDLFWNNETGRFVATIDEDGIPHDYGMTFLNLEAIYYGLPTEDQARSILDWIQGRRLVEGDTSQGSDIYHWRFAPRSTTKRNLEWYGWFWRSPESIPWGDQVQDGGAVLGFSFHDIMARLQVFGPDNAWRRLMEIGDWFAEVQSEGGYRAYYSKPGRGSLQGGGTPGGLGLDKEFLESILVPQCLLYGFLGFEPGWDGFVLNPRLPSTVPTLRISGIRWRDLVLDIKAATNEVSIRYNGYTDRLVNIALPLGFESDSSRQGGVSSPGDSGKARIWKVNLQGTGTLRFHTSKHAGQ